MCSRNQAAWLLPLLAAGMAGALSTQSAMAEQLTPAETAQNSGALAIPPAATEQAASTDPGSSPDAPPASPATAEQPVPARMAQNSAALSDPPAAAEQTASADSVPSPVAPPASPAPAEQPVPARTAQNLAALSDPPAAAEQTASAGPVPSPVAPPASPATAEQPVPVHTAENAVALSDPPAAAEQAASADPVQSPAAPPASPATAERQVSVAAAQNSGEPPSRPATVEPPSDSVAVDSTRVQKQSAVRWRVFPDAGADYAAVIEPLQEMLKNLGERPASVQDAQKWSDQLSQALRQGGFPVGQVLMTQQAWNEAVRSGQYVFTVFPGRISHISVNNASRVANERLQRLITHALCGVDTLTEGQGCLLRTSRLERATQLLQDVPGVSIVAAPRFSAGQQVGDTQVEFDLGQKGKPVQAGVVVDNNGMSATGRTRVGVSVAGNNVFHAGDAYALTLMDTEKHMWTGAASASAPIGDSGLRLAGSLTRQEYSINSVTPIVGVSTVAQMGVQYPFTRGLDSNVWGGLWLVNNRADYNLTEFGANTHSSINSVQLSLQADNGDRAMQLRANRWAVQSALTFGHDGNNDPGDTVARRAGDYVKLTAHAFGSYGLNASGDLFVTGQINAQAASRNLDASEELNLGGPGAVRAYRADEGSVDEGAIINLGLYRRFPVATGHQLQIGGFVDVGYGRVNHSPWDGWASAYMGVPNVKNIRLLSGYGLSLDWLTPFGATVSLAIARPFGFSSPSWVDPGKKPIQYWLTMAWSQ